MPHVKMSLKDFANSLVTLLDLDPVYVLCYRMMSKYEWEIIQRWLLAYWCYYDVGVATWMANAANETVFWKRFGLAALNGKVRRGAERRHFRGLKAEKAFAYLNKRGVESLFNDICPKPFEYDPIGVKQLRAIVEGWWGFGPWVSFKVADMVERLGIRYVDFSGVEMYSHPAKGADLVFDEYSTSYERSISSGSQKDRLKWAIGFLSTNTGKLLAPPNFNRGLNIQEYETILCKWKSYLSNSYHIGHDTEHVQNSLKEAATLYWSDMIVEVTDMAARVLPLWDTSKGQ